MATTYVTNKNEKVLTSDEIKQYYTLKYTSSTYQYAKKLIEDMVEIEKKEDENIYHHYLTKERTMINRGLKESKNLDSLKQYATVYHNARELYKIAKEKNDSLYLIKSAEELNKLKKKDELSIGHYMKGIRCLYHGSRLMLQDMLNNGREHYENNEEEFWEIKDFHERVQKMYKRLQL